MPNLINIEVTSDIAIKIRQLAEEGIFTLNKGNVIINIDNGNFLTLKVERITHPKTLSTENNLLTKTPHVTVVM